jgi:TrmH family RNA methyltransferase
MDITSLQNPRVRHIVKLRDDKRQRQKDGLMLVEGHDEIQLALSAGHKPRTLLTAPEIASLPLTAPSSRRYPIERTLMDGWRYSQFRKHLWMI